MDMFGDMREKERVTEDLVKVRQLYTRYKDDGRKNALMKASFGAFLCDITLQFLGGITSALLNFLAPFVILKLITFIEEGSSQTELTWESARPGVILSAILVGSQLLSQFI